MRARLVLASSVALVLLATPSLVRSQDKPDEKKEEKKDDDPTAEEPRLPFKLFEKAKEGDWSCYVYVSRRQGMGTARDTLHSKIDRIEDDEVQIVETKNLGLSTQESTADWKCPMKEAPTINDYLHLHWSAEISDVKIVDDKKTVLGKEFTCKKVTFVTTAQNQKNTFALWLCESVKGWGLVAMVSDGEGWKTFHNELELRGYGHGDKAEWGKKVSEVDPQKEEEEREKAAEKK